jgi:hypothetical protein
METTVAQGQIWLKGGSYYDAFLSGPCPEGLGYRECVRKGDRTGTYHWQDWVERFVCPHCGGSGFRAMGGVRLGCHSLYGLFCPACRRFVDVYYPVRGWVKVEGLEALEAWFEGLVRRSRDGQPG